MPILMVSARKDDIDKIRGLGLGADDYIRFTTTHFSTFAIVEKAEAEKLIAAQNADHIKALMQNAQYKVTTSKTSKKNKTTGSLLFRGCNGGNYAATN